MLSLWQKPPTFKSDNIDLGISSFVIAAIAKKQSTIIPIEKSASSREKKFSGNYSASAKNIYDSIVKKLGEKLAVVASTDEDIKKKYESRGIIPKHSYSVIKASPKIYNQKTYLTITLRNPHATVSTDYIRDKHGKYKVNVIDDSNGLIVLELNDFMKHFTVIDTEKKK